MLVATTRTAPDPGEDYVDRLTVGIVPVLLGGGRPLFGGRHPQLSLRLVDYTVQDGKVRLVYERR